MSNFVEVIANPLYKSEQKISEPISEQISDQKIEIVPNPLFKPKQEKQKKQIKQPTQTKVAFNKGIDLGVTAKKDDDFSKWYIQILEKAELISYSDISGCYVLRPNSYSIWEAIQNFFGKLIKDDGVKNTYFPCFVSQKALETEKENFEGFSPEVAWVTHSGETKLELPIAVRPTSETIMYPQFANWIRSHRDLPLRINQWCNVVRWEMKHCIPFIRSREFLWQEGHSAFATEVEADEEVLKILEFYRQVYEDLLAIPVTKGRKTEKEKFAGANYTTTIEGFIPQNGRAIQCATSHSLGQYFSKVFKIEYEKDNNKKLVWQNSWGLSTRTIGVMVMVHGDDKGLILPPRVADVQVVIVCIPCKKENNIESLINKADELQNILSNAGIRCVVDKTDNNPGWKYNYWETRGVPFRIELGKRDIDNESVVLCRRDTFHKQLVKWGNLISKIYELVTDMHQNLFALAYKEKENHTKMAKTFPEFIELLNGKNIVLVPFCGGCDCEDNIKLKSKDESIAQKTDETFELTGSAKSLCVPFSQPQLEPGTKCIGECGHDAESWTLFGRSY